MSTNFTDKERCLLIKLIKEKDYYKIIENKKTNDVTTKMKSDAWDKITADYNSIANIESRTKKQLTNCWKNSKARAKLDVARVRQEQLRTGGGPPPAPVSTITNLISGNFTFAALLL